MLLALSAHGQVLRGVPASVTSMGGNRTFVGGIPASVTSIAPTFPIGLVRNQINTGCSGAGMLIPSALGCPTGFTTPVNIQGPHGVGGRRGGYRGVPVYVPYAYPYGYPYGVYDSGQVGQQPAQVDGNVVDRRDYEDRYEDRRSEDRYRSDESSLRRARERDDREASRLRRRAEAAEPVREPEPAREVIPAVLIFNDGKKQEVRNYAIVGKVLYDFENMASRKIQLADLDLPATIKANDERGVDFTVPRN